MKYIYLEKIDSTNIKSRELFINAVENNQTQKQFIVRAGSQLVGRTTKKTRWQSGSNNLLVSILLENTYVEDENILLLSTLATYVVHKILKEIVQSLGINTKELRIKPPNDIFLNDQKLGGILLESGKYKKHRYVIFGIGINIQTAPKIENILYNSCCINDFLLDKNSKIESLSLEKISYKIAQNIELNIKRLSENSIKNIKRYIEKYKYCD
jgi:BirA family biotin operon repressor/biotin-[acetyl-CoA-carboxylase] ligase